MSDPARILVVEDDADTIELLGEQLEDLGYELAFARDGEEAILKTGFGAPDLIIMDYMMPRLDGLETTRYFKARFSDQFVPVMMLSAKGDKDSIAEGIRIGADEYTTKPYEARVLRTRIESLLKLQAAESLVRSEEPPADAADGVVVQRLSMAQDLCERGLYALARRYLERNTELRPDHRPSLELLESLGGRD